MNRELEQGRGKEKGDQGISSPTASNTLHGGQGGVGGPLKLGWGSCRRRKSWAGEMQLHDTETRAVMLQLPTKLLFRSLFFFNCSVDLLASGSGVVPFKALVARTENALLALLCGLVYQTRSLGVR